MEKTEEERKRKRHTTESKVFSTSHAAVDSYSRTSSQTKRSPSCAARSVAYHPPRPPCHLPTHLQVVAVILLLFLVRSRYSTPARNHQLITRLHNYHSAAAASVLSILQQSRVESSHHRRRQDSQTRETHSLSPVSIQRASCYFPRPICRTSTHGLILHISCRQLSRPLLSTPFFGLRLLLLAPLSAISFPCPSRPPGSSARESPRFYQ